MSVLLENSTWLISAVGAGVLCCLLIGLSRHRRLLNQQAIQLEKLETNLGVLTTSALGMGQKILQLEEKLKDVSSSQEEIKHADMEFAYTQAQKLISQGLDDGAVASNSGLSATEIALMRMLRQSDQARSVYHA